jgi:hypothetical protein
MMISFLPAMPGARTGNNKPAGEIRRAISTHVK